MLNLDEVGLTEAFFSFYFPIHRYEGALDPWMSSLWNTLSKMNPKFFPNGIDFLIQDVHLIDPPKVQITYHDVDKVHSHFSTDSGNVSL